METGLLHMHRGLAYLVFLATLVDMVVVLTHGRMNARTATAMRWAHILGVLMAGRLVAVGGVVVWVLSQALGLGVWWLWLSVLLWVGVELAAFKLVRPELAHVRVGGAASGRLMLGVIIELVAVIIMFGLMSARP